MTDLAEFIVERGARMNAEQLATVNVLVALGIDIVPIDLGEHSVMHVHRIICDMNAERERTPIRIGIEIDGALTMATT